MTSNTKQNRRMIFLAGPPGSGKTVLGQAVCEDLDLIFASIPARDSVKQQLARLKSLIHDGEADVVELTWELQQDTAAMKACRQAGELVALWGHPLEMHERSGRSEQPLTPKPHRTPTRGGFGANGTGCKEFRRLDKACEHVLLLVKTSLDDARSALHDCIAELLKPVSGSPAEQEGIDDWAKFWQVDFRADPAVTAELADAMALYLQQLKAQGKSPRSLNAVRDDLQAIAMLSFSYGYPVKSVDDISLWEYEFRRKWSDSKNAVNRYVGTYRKFDKFLKAMKKQPAVVGAHPDQD